MRLLVINMKEKSYFENDLIEKKNLNYKSSMTVPVQLLVSAAELLLPSFLWFLSEIKEIRNFRSNSMKLLHEIEKYRNR